MWRRSRSRWRATSAINTPSGIRPSNQALDGSFRKVRVTANAPNKTYGSDA